MKRSAVAMTCLLVVGSAPAMALPQAHEHGHQQEAYVPDRQEERDRDAWSKPEQVLDFVGVEEGDTVADMFAARGYFSWFLAHRIGSEGTLYAERGNDSMRRRVAEGDLQGVTQVVFVQRPDEIPPESLDAALAVRAYHLERDWQTYLEGLYRGMKPGGTVGIVELRLGRPRGHDWDTHRLGEETVIEQFESVGFVFAESSDILRQEGDDYSAFRGGERHEADRMLLKFRKPGSDGE